MQKTKAKCKIPVRITTEPERTATLAGGLEKTGAECDTTWSDSIPLPFDAVRRGLVYSADD